VAADEIGRFYPDSYNAHALPANAVLRMLATTLFRWRDSRALRRAPLGVLSRVPPGRLLDVGAGRGDLGVVLGAQGWKVTGLEPSAEACEEARGRGVHMVQGTLGKVDSDDLGSGYDALVFRHALEHVVEPKEDLRLARELLRPGGRLLIAVPNFGSWQRRRFGSQWFNLDLPRHRSHFAPVGLEQLLCESGFEQVELTTSTTADGLPGSLEYRFFGRRLFRGGLPLYMIFTLALALVPLSAVANALGGGGDELDASAMRPPAR
jgi:SAM-dependent methyltransferase